MVAVGVTVSVGEVVGEETVWVAGAIVSVGVEAFCIPVNREDPQVPKAIRINATNPPTIQRVELTLGFNSAPADAGSGAGFIGSSVGVCETTCARGGGGVIRSLEEEASGKISKKARANSAQVL